MGRGVGLALLMPWNVVPSQKNGRAPKQDRGKERTGAIAHGARRWQSESGQAGQLDPRDLMKLVGSRGISTSELATAFGTPANLQLCPFENP